MKTLKRMLGKFFKTPNQNNTTKTDRDFNELEEDRKRKHFPNPIYHPTRSQKIKSKRRKAQSLK